MSEYRVEFYKNSRTGREPVTDYMDSLRPKERLKIVSQIILLREKEGRLPEPYCKHVDGKIWELRIQFSPNKHRILYVTMSGKLIILLHAFTKKTAKIPPSELSKAYSNYQDVLLNLNQYNEKI